MTRLLRLAFVVVVATFSPLAAGSARANTCGPIAVATIATQPWRPIRSAEADGCVDGAAARVSADVLVARCRIEADPTALDREPPVRDAMVVLRGGAIVFHDVDVAPPSSDDAGVTVVRVDLSGDGDSETLVARRMSEGQGLGVVRWTLDVFDADWRHLGQALEVADWGPTAFVPRPSGAGCAALLTSWIDMEGPGDAVTRHFAATRADVRGDRSEFSTLPEGRWVSRRLTRRFAEERDRDIARAAGPHRDPAAWLAREIAHALKQETRP